MTKHKMTAENFAHVLNNNQQKKLKGAPFTIRGKKTGKDYTYLLKQNVYNGVNYIHVYIEYSYLEFSYLGYFRDGFLLKKGGVVVETESAKGIAWILKNILGKNIDAVDAQADIFHMGKCAKCGKPLTDATSIEIGVGPVCRSL
jgi:hypothetical protein